MTLFIIGTIIFFALHLLPSLPLRASLVVNMGAKKYKTLCEALNVNWLNVMGSYSSGC